MDNNNNNNYVGWLDNEEWFHFLIDNAPQEMVEQCVSRIRWAIGAREIAVVKTTKELEAAINNMPPGDIASQEEYFRRIPTLYNEAKSQLSQSTEHTASQ